jgi:hypothetical protein
MLLRGRVSGILPSYTQPRTRRRIVSAMLEKRFGKCDVGWGSIPAIADLVIRVGYPAVESPKGLNAVTMPSRAPCGRPAWKTHGAQLGFSAEREIACVALRSRRAANEDSAVGDKVDLAFGRDGEKVASPIPIVEVKRPLAPVRGPCARARESLARREQARN